MQIGEPAIDLAVAVAIASSRKDRQVAADIALMGEIGLSGELRAVGQLPPGSKKRPSWAFAAVLSQKQRAAHLIDMPMGSRSLGALHCARRSTWRYYLAREGSGRNALPATHPSSLLYRLFNSDNGAFGLQLGLGVLGQFLADRLEDDALAGRSIFHRGLGLAQTQSGRGADRLDDLDLLGAGYR